MDDRLEFLSMTVFKFVTYDAELDALFVRKALATCSAISNKDTASMVFDKENYLWFVVMCNMPFFEGKLSWGTSIRYAYWDRQ